MPGIIEWPDRIPKRRVTDLNVVTSDMLPTICDLTGQPLPPRPLDGISLKRLVEGEMTERPKPICFWQYDQQREIERNPEPYIQPELRQGTTPTASLLDGSIRSFRNYRHPHVREEDFAGSVAVLDNRYKLVSLAKRSQESSEALPSRQTRELYEVRSDQGETKNLVHVLPEIAREMEGQLRDWQRSVLTSLTGADYRESTLPKGSI